MPCWGYLRMRWSCRIGLAATALLLLAALEPAAAESKRVVLLHSFGQDFKPWSEYARSIRSELQRQSPWQLDITDHSLVTARSSNEDPKVPFVAYLNALFAEPQPDLIVCIGAPAAVFVQRHRPQLFASILMVFTAVEEHAASKVEVVVSDSGPGIPEQVIDEMFDTFYTTKPHGTGLGLSIERTIVDTYGGKIWAENRPEGGAAFHFTIPLNTDLPAQPKSIQQCPARAYAEA
jgi:hypothetical protein